MLRRSAAASLVLVLSISAACAAQDKFVDDSDMPRAKPPQQLLQGGVQQDQDLSDLASDQNWELQARSLAAEQQEAQTGAFMGSPLVFRVTSVGEINKSNGTQKITALPIHSVTISADGTVDLGQIVDGSGDGFEVPPGTLQKGDLFTRVQNQFIKVPANHFDPMGSLADQVNKQLPPDSPSALNKLANQLANAADNYKNNGGAFTNDFLLAAGNVMGGTLQFLSQPRGDFGQPGKPLQDILNFLNNDNAAVNAQLGQAAQQAMQTLATRPGAFAGNLFMAMLPAGQLGKESELAQLSQATQRLTALENAAGDFASIERGLPPSRLTPSQYPTVPGNAALAHANYPPGGPGIPEPYLPGTPTINRPVPPAPPVAPIGPGDTVPTPGDPTPVPPYPTVPGNAALKHANYPPGGPGIPDPYLPGEPTINRPAPPAPPVAAPSGAGDTVPTPISPRSPLQSRNIPARTPQKAIPMTPQQRQALQDNLNKLLPALDQDAKWAGEPLSATPSAPSSSSDILNTLQSRFGTTPKDPLLGAPGLLESRFGIPTPATPASITSALQLAGNHAQALIFWQNPDHSLSLANARNTNGTIEFLDPATQRRAQPPANSPLYFYRTH